MLKSLTLCAALLFTLPAFCADKIGDEAPEVDGIKIVHTPDFAKKSKDKAVKNFVKNDKLTFERNRVYIVEFWATWCGPCVAMMPHLDKLQETYADSGLIVIGITNEVQNEAGVKKAVSGKEGARKYHIALDTKDEAYKQFFYAFKQRGIPCSFVVDKEGKITYCGHPSRVDAAVKKALDAPDVKEAKPAKKESTKKPAAKAEKAEKTK